MCKFNNITVLIVLWLLVFSVNSCEEVSTVDASRSVHINKRRLFYYSTWQSWTDKFI